MREARRELEREENGKPWYWPFSCSPPFVCRLASSSSASRHPRPLPPLLLSPPHPLHHHPLPPHPPLLLPHPPRPLPPSRPSSCSSSSRFFSLPSWASRGCGSIDGERSPATTKRGR